MSMSENVTFSGDFNDIDPSGLFDPGDFDISTVMSDFTGMEVEPEMWQRDDSSKCPSTT